MHTTFCVWYPEWWWCVLYAVLELCDEMEHVEIVTSYEELVRRHVVSTFLLATPSLFQLCDNDGLEQLLIV